MAVPETPAQQAAPTSHAAETPRRTACQKTAFPIRRAARTPRPPRTMAPRTPARRAAPMSRAAEAACRTTCQKARAEAPPTAFPARRAARVSRPPRTMTPETLVAVPGTPARRAVPRSRAAETPRRTTCAEAPPTALPVRQATRMSWPSRTVTPMAQGVIPARRVGCAPCPAGRPSVVNHVDSVDLVIRHTKVGNIRTGMRAVGSASITLLLPCGTASRVGGGVDPVIDNLSVTKSGYVGVMRFPGCCPDAHAVRA